MCLITDQKTPFIAEKDIIVYKALIGNNDGTARSVYIFNHEYILEKLYKTTIKSSTSQYSSLDNEDSEKIDKAYNLRRSPYAMSRRDAVLNGELMSYTQGFHSALDKNRLRNEPNYSSNVSIFECTIPEGSEYYTNPSGLVISNAIIINKPI